MEKNTTGWGTKSAGFESDILEGCITYQIAGKLVTIRLEEITNLQFLPKNQSSKDALLALTSRATVGG